MKALKSKNESMTFAEVEGYEHQKMDEVLVYLKSIVDSTDSTDDEKANVMVNMSKKLGEWRAMILLEGLLSDEKTYLKDIFGEDFEDDTVVIEEVDANGDALS